MHVPTVRNVVCLTKTETSNVVKRSLSDMEGQCLWDFFYSVKIERKLLRACVFDVDR